MTERDQAYQHIMEMAEHAQAEHTIHYQVAQVFTDGTEGSYSVPLLAGELLRRQGREVGPKTRLLQFRREVGGALADTATYACVEAEGLLLQHGVRRRPNGNALQTAEPWYRSTSFGHITVGQEVVDTWQRNVIDWQQPKRASELLAQEQATGGIIERMPLFALGNALSQALLDTPGRAYTPQRLAQYLLEQDVMQAWRSDRTLDERLTTLRGNITDMLGRTTIAWSLREHDFVFQRGILDIDGQPKRSFYRAWPSDDPPPLPDPGTDEAFIQWASPQQLARKPPTPESREEQLEFTEDPHASDPTTWAALSECLDRNEFGAVAQVEDLVAILAAFPRRFFTDTELTDFFYPELLAAARARSPTAAGRAVHQIRQHFSHNKLPALIGLLADKNLLLQSGEVRHHPGQQSCPHRWKVRRAVPSRFGELEGKRAIGEYVICWEKPYREYNF